MRLEVHEDGGEEGQFPMVTEQRVAFLHEIAANINLIVQLGGWKKDSRLYSTTS